MSDTAVLDKPETIEQPKFVTFSDRCDQSRCGAAAQQRATSPKGKFLLFCNHHGNEHEILLMAAGFTIQKSEESLCTCQMCVPTQIDEQGNTVVHSEDEPGPEGPVPA